MRVIRSGWIAAIGDLGHESRAADRQGPNSPRTEDSGRHAGNQSVRGYVVRNHAARRHHCALADGYATEDRGVGADAGAPADVSGHQTPPGFSEELSVLPDRRRVEVICEARVRADEGSFLDSHPAGDERERQHFDIPTQVHIALDLDEGCDLAAIANDASIQIDELGMRNDDVATELNVRRDQG